jgi:5-methylcytosine-specific restriction endonuclease McrA
LGAYNKRDLFGDKNGMFGSTRSKDKNPNYKHGKSLLHKCKDCNTLIPGYYERCGSCSKKGNHNPNWKDGKTLEIYPSKFNDELKESIRRRDNYICQNCGMTEEEHLIVVGRIIEVHHIDYNKQNCKENNLITLCYACNTRANFNRDYWHDFYQQKIGAIYDRYF